MESFTRECLEFDGTGIDSNSSDAVVAESMTKVYEGAAELVMMTLDLASAVVVDVSAIELQNPRRNEQDSDDDFRSIVPTPPDIFSTTSMNLLDPIPALTVLGAAGEKNKRAWSPETLDGRAHAELVWFLNNSPNGRLYDTNVPSCFKGLFPEDTKYAMGKLQPLL